jgi:hypothetical protein
MLGPIHFSRRAFQRITELGDKEFQFIAQHIRGHPNAMWIAASNTIKEIIVTSHF